ncbi:hypothetical protein PHISCL_02614 [Aspergillus sclerotialis]|uniref:Aminoglycoside phosphotransferase domain-containing protein n=1 Tax=Aspergillus sclerotialis TaxID=2070753 RepID=A0A3A2ZPG3_9EURO|nr:hypothetical protein PHISCL_02614 [Aspergillus sclerotialis]
MSIETQVSVTMEYHGLKPSPGAYIPTVRELLNYCTAVNPENPHYAMGLPYPRDAPVFWIKYGAIPWNSIPAQAMAYHELRKLGSPVTAPGLLESVEDSAEKEVIYRKVGFALHELHRIPIPKNARPAAIDGGPIWHTLFDDQQAPRHYQSADQLEQHLNLWLKITKRQRTVQRLSKEPMVFCQSDLYLGNFMIDHHGNVLAIDFAITNILPSSFSKFAILAIDGCHEYPMLEWANVPSADGIDNTAALCAAVAPMVMGPSSFATCGRRIQGAEWKPEYTSNGDGLPVHQHIGPYRDIILAFSRIR